MAIESHEISTYSVSLAASAGSPTRPRPAATIHVCTAPAEGAPQAQAYLRFYRGNHTLPPNRRIINGDGGPMYLVSYPYEQLSDAVDLLRYEKPMFFRFHHESMIGHLATSREPVGEGDNDADFIRDSELPAALAATDS